MNRRKFTALTGMAFTWSLVSGCRVNGGEEAMYGLISQMIAATEKRDDLIEILLGGTKNMPGCLNYVIAKDSENEDALWITEVWESQDSHTASLSIPSVQDAIARGKPLISGFGQRIETTPIGGHGIRAA